MTKRNGTPRGKAGHRYGLPLDTVPKAVRNTAQRYHWGVQPAQVIEWKDKDVPDVLQEMGRLCEIHILPRTSATGRAGSAVVITIPEEYWNDFPRGRSAKASTRAEPVPRRQQAHLAWDAAHRHQRMYLLLPDELLHAFKGLFRARIAVNLRDLSVVVGGHHGTRDYADVQVTPIGDVTHLTYYSHKSGDEDNGDDQIGRAHV